MRKQLIVIFLSFGIIPALLLAALIVWLSSNQGMSVLHRQVTEKLISQREAKKSEVEAYLALLQSQVKTLSNDLMVIHAMNEFKDAFVHYRDEAAITAGPQQRRSLRDYYEKDFQQRYKSRNSGQSFDVDTTLAQLDDDSIALQYSYISNNPEPLGEKDALMAAPDQSTYSQLHKRYHPHFRAFLQEFGYYDIFLVDPESGDVVYTVFKELDFTTSLKDGPYAKSGLGQAFQKANTLTDRDAVALIDFAPYTPSYEDPAAFIASPIFDGEKKLGILIFQMPVDRLNEIMTYGGKWADVGLGSSGETYLVADDFTMRSIGRFFIDDREAYLNALKASGISPDIIKKISEKETTLGLQPVNTPGAKAALAGKSGASIFPDYRNVPVLSAYAPIDVDGLNWAILSEVDEAEAFAPVTELVRVILFWSLGALILISAVTAIISFRYASVFVAPLQYITSELTEIAENIKRGSVDLTKSLNPPGNSQLAKTMAVGINTMLENFSGVLREFSQATHRISSSVHQLSELSKESSNNMNTQRAETDMVASAITELSASSKEVANNAQIGADAAKVADMDTKAGSETVNEAASTIKDLVVSLEGASKVVYELADNSNSIGSVLDVIQGIAEQTNLLALNAAIEAARAGEQGRGFAVVADEVRTLAARTQDATQEIKDIIDQLQMRSKQAVEVMDTGCEKANSGLDKAVSAGEALNDIAVKVADIDNMNAIIAAAAQEQCNVAEEVSQSVEKINQLTEKTTLEATQTSQASEELLQLASRLQKLVAQFKVA